MGNKEIDALSTYLDVTSAIGKPVPHMPRTFDTFMARVRSLLGGTASEKGYSDTGPEGKNELYEFIMRNVAKGPHAHALGEIVYKTVRFASKGNIEDIEKVAAWAYLIVKHYKEG